MSKKTPKYEFNSAQNLEFELTTISHILKKSKSKITFPHKQDFYGLFYFTNSYGKHFVDFKEYDIKKGDIFFISNEQVHYFENIDNTEGNVILFTNSFLENDFLINQIFELNTGNPILSLNEQLLKDFETLILQISSVFSSTKKMKVEILKKYLEIILLEIYQYNQENLVLQNINYQRFLQFKKDLKEHFNKEKAVKFYADKQFISTKTLNIATREIINQSAKQYISEYIVLLAKRMLTSTSFTTTEIAYELGFDEPTNFTKFFKKKEKVTPVMFQKEHKFQ